MTAHTGEPSSTTTFPRPTLRVVAALALLAVATVALRLPGTAAAAVLAGVTAAWCVDAVAVRRGPVAFSLLAPATTTRGGHDALGLRVTAAGRVARLRQPVPPELELEPPEAPLGALDAVLRPTFRGTYVLAGPVARVVGPLGLATVDVSGAGGHEVRVLPDLPRAKRLAVRRRGAPGAEGAAVRRRGIGTEFESVRDYDENDDVRFVNWMATSRVGRPMTNQYRVDENRDLVCLVDAGRLMCGPVGQATRLDVALDALCVLGVVADDAGDRVGATAFAGSVLRQVAPARRGTGAVVEALFDLQPVEVESDFSLAFQRVAGRKRSIVVVFTDLVDPAASRPLVDALPVLARRHEVLVVAVRDDTLEALATTAPSEYADVTRAAVALRLLDEHHEVVRRVSALGAHVVVAGPEQLGPACVAAYTRVKSLARA